MLTANTDNTLICFNGNLLQAMIAKALFSQFKLKFVDNYNGEKGYIFDTTNTVAKKIDAPFAIVTILSNPSGDMPSYVVSYPYTDFMNIAGKPLIAGILRVIDDFQDVNVFGYICSQVQKQTGLSLTTILYNPDDQMEFGLVDLLNKLFLQHNCKNTVSIGLSALKEDGLFVANNQTGELIMDIKVDILGYTICGNFVIGNSVTVYSTPVDHGEGDIVKDALCIMTGIAESLLSMQPKAQQAGILNGIIDNAHDYYLSGLAKDQQSDEDKVKDMIGYVQGMITELV